MRVGSATSQLDLPSLPPLSIAGCGRNNQTQSWAGEMLHIHPVRMPPSLGREASCLGTTKQGDQIWEQKLRHVAHI